jgi:hypothetical protein
LRIGIGYVNNSNPPEITDAPVVKAKRSKVQSSRVEDVKMNTQPPIKPTNKLNVYCLFACLANAAAVIFVSSESSNLGG